MSNSSKESFVEEDLDALAGGELAALVLGLDALLAAAEPRDVAAAGEFFQDGLHGRLPAFASLCPRHLM